jgi:tartrate-resistant acid phosphatase type 5
LAVSWHSLHQLDDLADAFEQNDLATSAAIFHMMRRGNANKSVHPGNKAGAAAMNTTSFSTTVPVTRREAIRRTLLFSAGTLLASRSGTLNAAPAVNEFDGQGIHLLALGDYGTKGNERQVSVANAMSKFAKSLDRPLTAVLALGDNFYRKITANRFERHFENMYSKDGLNCPFYACLGNHDYGTAKYDQQEGKAQLQLDYAANNPISRWKMPSKWYTFELPDSKNPLVKVVTLDGNYWEGALTPKEKIKQRRFLEAELKAPTSAAWLWVVNHFPMFSECSNRGDNKPLLRDWGPLIKSSRASLCLAGHDHTMQHLRIDGYSPSFIVSGAGGAGLYKVNRKKRGFADNQHLGFNHIFVTPERLQLQFINTSGECLHHFTRELSGKITIHS